MFRAAAHKHGSPPGPALPGRDSLRRFGGRLQARTSALTGKLVPLLSLVMLSVLVPPADADAQPPGLPIPALPLPLRPANAKPWSQLRDEITSLPLAAREEAIFREVMSGNVPGFSRRMIPVSAQANVAGTTVGLAFFAAADYLAVGSDTDFCRMPMTPILAQRIADRLNCKLPTCKMVADIWAAAEAKFQPQPIPPSPLMGTIPVFDEHNRMIESQRTTTAPLGTSIAGVKKDIVITPRMLAKPDKVAIYGWHRPDGSRIQPLYLGHAIWYADYSHGLRLVRPEVYLTVPPTTSTVEKVLADPGLCVLLTDEGVTTGTRYRTDPAAYPKDR